MLETLNFQIIAGLNKGYFHNNNCDDCYRRALKIWQEIAQEEFETSGIYVTAVIRKSKTIYSKEWGCPEGGEDTIIISGTANPKFIKDLGVWKEKVLYLAAKFKEQFEQESITCEFTRSELYYFND